MRRLIPTFVLVWLAVSEGTLAQVTATQGREGQGLSPTEFTSPMILEVPAPDLRRMQKDLPWLTKETAPYSCDGVRLDALNLTLVGEQEKTRPDGSGKERILVYQLVAHVWSPPSKDRFVGLHIQLKVGDRYIGSVSFPNIEAEEGKFETARAKLLVKAAELDSLASGEVKPVLRVAMTVKVDD